MSRGRVLLDTGPLVALLSASDPHHQICKTTFSRLRPPLLTCWPVLTEAAWMLRHESRPVEQIATILTGGLLEILPLEAECLRSIAAIMTRYGSARIQLADAALVHLADREQIQTLFTLDRRDFSILRLSRNRSLRLIPDLS